MATADSNVRVASPGDIHPNPENPRLIFHEKELLELESSIASNGILVPLTVYQSSNDELILLDGERRWRCAKKLGLHRVPVIVQPEPSLMQNIMMMFAIHNARSDWDPLPTALKLRKLEEICQRDEGRPPTESQLAQLASLSRGEVRRLKNILKLPQDYLALIEEQQDRPRSEQTLTVDHLLEVTRGARALEREEIIDLATKEALEKSLINKFQAGRLTSTVEPRLLTRMARAVRRNDVDPSVVATAIDQLVTNLDYTVSAAYEDSVSAVELSHDLEMAAQRLTVRLVEDDGPQIVSESLRATLLDLRGQIDALLSR